MATLRVTMLQRMAAQEVRNTLHVAGGDAVQANAQGIIDYFASVWSTQLSAQLSDKWELYGGTARELDLVSNPTIDYNLTAGAITGGSAADILPTQVAFLVSWIALTAKPNRGRTYLAGFTEAHIGPGGFFDTTIENTVQSWADAILDVDTPFPGLALVVTRVDRNTGVLVGSNLIDSARMNRNPATMRSRRVGQGI